jgi:hypothetical protein
MQFLPDLCWDTPAGTAGWRALALRPEESDEGNVDHDDSEENDHRLPLGTKNAMNPMVIVD